jgi:hypothetical protein
MKYKHYFENKENHFYKVQRSISNPYEYSAEVRNFIKELYDLDLVQPFNWVQWKDSDQGRKYFASPKRINDANLEDVIKVLTTHLRLESVLNGHLTNVIKDGQFSIIIDRLQKLSLN